MIRTQFPIGHSMVLALSIAAAACEVHDNTINIPNATVNATVNASVDVDNVQAGQEVPVNVMVQNVYLVAPDATPPAEHKDDAGHLQVYLDDVSTEPLAVTAEAMFNVTVPPATKAGKHHLICRVHRHDKTPTTTKVQIEITVTVSGTVSDASVTVTVDANAADAGATGGAGGAGGASGEGGAGGAQ